MEATAMAHENSESKSDSMGFLKWSLLEELFQPSIGPSSSHTRGPARLGKVAHDALQEAPRWAKVTLWNSLAQTGDGHGTKRAVIAGLLGREPFDPLVAEADDRYARQHGLRVIWVTHLDPTAEPVMLEIEVVGRRRRVYLRGVSPGGGRIRVEKLEVHPLRPALRPSATKGVPYWRL
jgi:iron-sulfur-dependent L-serine dehydratase beta subunit